MKTILFAFMTVIPGFYLQAQTIDSLDNIKLKISKEWEITRQTTYIGLTRYNKSHNSFCMAAFYQQQPALADKNASFRQEWNDLVLASFEADADAAPQIRKIKAGNVFSFGTTAVNKANRLPYYVELHMFDCGNSVQSLLLTSGSKQHLTFYDSLWQALIVNVRKNTTTQSTVTTTPTSLPFQGLWGKSSSSPYGLDPGTVITNAGYTKCQYNFKPNGTYTMHGESGGGALSSNNYAVMDESGTYTVSGNQLLIKPAKSKLLLTDRDGNIKKTTNLDISKRTYIWKTHYFEGLNETQLVLTPAKEYFQDGGFSSNSLFPNSYLYSQNTSIEWRIQPK